MRVRKENLGRGLFKDAPGIHEHDAVGHRAGEGHFVGDDQQGHAIAGQALDHFQHLLDHLWVEGGGDFVKQHDLGVHAQRANDGDALLLATGQLAREGVALVGQAYTVQQPLCLLAGFTGVALLHFQRAEQEVVEHAHVRKQVVILGPSGCGKSTLLRCLNGLEVAHSGSLRFAGKQLLDKSTDWRQVRQDIGMVFQSYHLFPHMSVLDNLLLGPLKVQKRNLHEAREQAEQLLARVGLADKCDAFPRQLSGGQQQRIAIVRSLCMNPQVMLFDEVTAALDPEMVKEVLEVIQGLARDGMTLLIVTHEMAFARAVADRVVFMEAGRILEHNTPEAFFTNPQTARAQQFLEKFSFVSTLPKKIKELELI